MASERTGREQGEGLPATVIDANVVAYAVFGPQDLRETAWVALCRAKSIVVPDLTLDARSFAVADG